MLAWAENHPRNLLFSTSRREKPWRLCALVLALYYGFVLMAFLKLVNVGLEKFLLIPTAMFFTTCQLVSRRFLRPLLLLRLSKIDWASGRSSWHDQHFCFGSEGPY